MLFRSGRITNPPSDEKLRRLEQSLGFGVGELVGQAHLERTPSDVRAVLTKLVNSSADGQAGDAEVLHRLVGKSIDVSQSVATAAIRIINDAVGGFVSCPDIHDEKAFAARVSGDSMMPRYRDGDVVIFAPSVSPRSGDDCFVRFDDGKTTFKRVFMETDEMGEAVLRLQPRNEKYRAQVVISQKIVGLFRAIYRYERIEGEA